MLKVVEEGKASASEHMARDRSILSQGGEMPLLSFYEWDSFCVTYGLFAGPEGILKSDACREQGIEVVARPTGGGILFHQDDIPFSLFVPMEGAQSAFSWEIFWVKIQEKVLQKLQPILEGMPKERFSKVFTEPVCQGRFCMLEAHGCDFVWKGKKFGGAAFRKGKKGLLCQASLFFGDFPWERSLSCVDDPSLIETMREVSVSLSLSSRKVTRADLKHTVGLAVKETFYESRCS